MIFVRVLVGMSSILLILATAPLLIVAYSSALRLSILAFMFITGIVGIVYVVKGKRLWIWLLLLAMCFILFVYEEWRVENKKVKFCEEEIFNKCEIEEGFKISCPLETGYNSTFTWNCEDLLIQKSLNN